MCRYPEWKFHHCWMSTEEELEHLKHIRAELELRLKYINDRVAELEKMLAGKEKKP